MPSSPIPFSVFNWSSLVRATSSLALSLHRYFSGQESCDRPCVPGHVCHPLPRCTHIPLGCTNPTQTTAYPVFVEGNGHAEVWDG